MCQWLVEAGVDAIHVSTGSFFPHPRNPAGVDLPVEDLAKRLRHDDLERRADVPELPAVSRPLRRRSRGARGTRRPAIRDKIEGANLPDARAIKQAVTVPVICTGGFQTASVIRDAIERGDCDAVSAARPLVANNDLVRDVRAAASTRAPKPCTYCNKCLVNVVENPLGCYDETRFDSRDEMIAQIMSVFTPAPFRRCGHDARRLRRAVRRLCAVAVAGLRRSVAASARRLRRRVAAQDDIVTHFKYGSVGTEGTVGLPYPIWRVLPVLFADKLPNRPGRGLREARIHLRERMRRRAARSAPRYVEDRVPLVGLNCATCHTGTVRESPTSPQPDHPRHAGAPDGPAGLRELPDRAAPRIRASKPAR